MSRIVVTDSEKIVMLSKCPYVHGLFYRHSYKARFWVNDSLDGYVKKERVFWSYRPYAIEEVRAVVSEDIPIEHIAEVSQCSVTNELI